VPSRLIASVRSAAPLWAAILLLFGGQVLVSQHLKPFRPAIEEMPYPPNPLALKALGLGDDQFLFRAEVSWLQGVGDGGGRLKPLKDYDYDRVIEWLRVIDGLDPQSRSLFEVGARYFGAISDPGSAPLKLKALATYFLEVGMSDPAQRWPWLVWAAVKAQHTIGDKELARRAADQLMSLRGAAGAPYWLPLLAPPLYRAAGDSDRAALVMADPDMIRLRQRAFTELNGRLSQMGSFDLNQ